MVIYGIKSSHLRTEPLLGVACPSCSAPKAMQLSVFSRYAHAYWIPFFPFAKAAVAHCTHCQLTLDGKAMPEAAREQARDLKQQTRLPLWTWSGVGLVAAGLAWAAVAGTQNARANKAYLAAPRAGDIYTIHSTGDSTQYSLLKVVSAKGNTVEVVANEYEIDNSHPIDELNAPTKYGSKSFSLTQFELQIMQNKGQLTDVDRLAE
ncbi:hypothetical protein [Hymenobacter terricola]|uniref:hypothetical protein n=1 Tax=Hymenobacter terricola TaxID=2819236 RepID=UPI001B30377F|nr:hypothetical protein [Hymenobacter terricola]